jgi:hypothetical protein
MVEAICMKKTLTLVLALAALLSATTFSAQGATTATAAVAGQGLTAQIVRLASQPIDGYRYDWARRCTGGPQRGALALQGWLAAHVKGVSWGIYNCRKTRLGSNLSLHAEGRAVDWHLDVHKRADRATAYQVIHALLAPDASGRPHALARRMGLQEIIYNCSIWSANVRDGGMRPYSGCKRGVSDTIAHRDHLHLGLNWRGAREQSTFWRLAPAPRR